MRRLRHINFFEVALLIIGLGVGFIGMWIITNQYNSEPVLTWDLFQTVFLWLMLIVVFILAATMEDVKEELAIILKEQVAETKILKDINKNLLEETKLLRDELRKPAKKR